MAFDRCRSNDLQADVDAAAVVALDEVDGRGLIRVRRPGIVDGRVGERDGWWRCLDRCGSVRWRVSRSPLEPRQDFVDLRVGEQHQIVGGAIADLCRNDIPPGRQPEDSVDTAIVGHRRRHGRLGLRIERHGLDGNAWGDLSTRVANQASDRGAAGEGNRHARDMLSHRKRERRARPAGTLGAERGPHVRRSRGHDREAAARETREGETSLVIGDHGAAGLKRVAADRDQHARERRRGRGPRDDRAGGSRHCDRRLAPCPTPSSRRPTHRRGQASGKSFHETQCDAR